MRDRDLFVLPIPVEGPRLTSAFTGYENVGTLFMVDGS